MGHGYTRVWVHGEIVIIGAPKIAGQFAVPRLGTVDPYSYGPILEFDYDYRQDLRGHIDTGWWFGTFFIFPYIGNNHPN